MENKRNLLAGYGRKCITPDYEVCISGYGDDEVRRSQGVVDDIYTTCIAITEAEETVLLFTTDLLSVHDGAADQLRERLVPELGIPGDHMFFGATHSHSGPLLYGDQPDAVRFREMFIEQCLAAAEEALADRAPAVMESVTAEVPNMNFIRHYEMNDGTYLGSNFGSTASGFKCHARPTDPRMILVRFRREEKPDIVMMNWQAHNDNVRQVGYYYLSSSYVGHVRKEFEKLTQTHFAFFQGASGDQNAVSRIQEEDPGLNYIQYGEKMAQYAVAALPKLMPVTGSGIKTRHLLFEAPVDHSWDHMLEQANEVFKVWKTVGKKEGDALGKTYGFTSSYQSRDIRIRAAMGPTLAVQLNAFRIGDMGFVTSPNEVFSTVGIHVRANAPFETVFIITGNSRYLPCAEAYEYRSYEADTGMFAKGAAEKVAQTWTEMLKEVFPFA